MKILCLGDSLTFGARDEYGRGYPAELSRLFWERDKEDVQCINVGMNGDTSSDVLRRCYGLSQCLTLVLIGTNDTKVNMPLDIYEDNLRQIYFAREANTIWGLLPPLTGAGLPSYPKDGNKQIEEFNKIIIKKFVRTADFRSMGEYIIDTAHFNHQGYVKMAEIWYEAICKYGLV